MVKLSENKRSYQLQGFEAHTLNLHEDMAAVEYIFADKTGTLTQNELIFQQLTVFDGKSQSTHDSKTTDYSLVSGAKDLFNCIALC